MGANGVMITVGEMAKNAVADTLMASQHARAVAMGRYTASAAGLDLAAALANVDAGRRVAAFVEAIRKHACVTAAITDLRTCRVEIRIEPRVFAWVYLAPEHIKEERDPRDLALKVADLLG